MNQADIDRIPRWFHAMNLGPGLVTPGRFPNDVPPNYTLFPVFEFLEGIDVEGFDCLDVGVMDGMVSFILRLRGARVVATELSKRQGFLLARDHLKLNDVAYLTQSYFDLSLEKRLVDEALPNRFDLIVLSGVIYHTFDPLVNIMLARRLAKRGGMVIVETAYHPGDEAVLHFNWDAPAPIQSGPTYLLPTVTGLLAMLRFACLDPVATVVNGKRLAVLAVATGPAGISGGSETLSMLHTADFGPGPVNFMGINDVVERSDIAYVGRRGTWKIDRYSFETTLPLQPQRHFAQRGGKRGWPRNLFRKFISRAVTRK